MSRVSHFHLEVILLHILVSLKHLLLRIIVMQNRIIRKHIRPQGRIAALLVFDPFMCPQTLLF